MTAKANHSTQLRSCPSPLVLFGIDSRGKPKGARFGREHASLAIKAATQLQLNVLASNDPNVAEIAGRLPVGRVHATGRTFVPFIRRDLYDRLVAATGNGNGASPVRLTHAGVAAASPPSGNPNLPRSWHEIALGDLVVGQESLEDGWYEAIVIEVNGDMLTLRWRDYPPRDHDHASRRILSSLASRGPDLWQANFGLAGLSTDPLGGGIQTSMILMCTHFYGTHVPVKEPSTAINNEQWQ
jgi:hypothetical protein